MGTLLPPQAQTAETRQSSNVGGVAQAATCLKQPAARLPFRFSVFERLAVIPRSIRAVFATRLCGLSRNCPCLLQGHCEPPVGPRASVHGEEWPIRESDQLAGGLGFEPRLTESESAVLPLNYPPTGRCREQDPERAGCRERRPLNIRPARRRQYPFAAQSLCRVPFLPCNERLRPGDGRFGRRQDLRPAQGCGAAAPVRGAREAPAARSGSPGSCARPLSWRAASARRARR